MRTSQKVRHTGVAQQATRWETGFAVLFLATVLLGRAVTAADWRFVLNAPASSQETLAVGMDEAATDDFDDGLDEETPVAPPFALGSLYAARFDNGVLDITLSSDIRSVSETARWSVVGAAPTDSELVISWDTDDHSLPVDGLLSLVETSAEGGVLSDGERLVIDGTGQTSVPAGATRYFEIKYITGPYSIVNLEAGWNLISLPLKPSSNDPDDVFEDLGPQGLGGMTKTPFKTVEKQTAPVRSVWSWHPLTRSYHPAETIAALVPYWVYAHVPMQIAIPGAAVSSSATYRLRRGWNLFGVRDAMGLPANPPLRGYAWYWDAAAQDLQLTDTLVPGLAYWVNCATATTISAE